MPELTEYLSKAFLERQGQDLPAVLESLQVARDRSEERRVGTEC